MEQINKYKYLLKNTLLFAFGSFGSKLISFFLVPLYTSVLTTADYGIADMLTVTKTIASSIFTICIADAVMLFAMQNREKRNQVFKIGLHIILESIIFVGVICLLLWKFDLINWPKYCYAFLFIEYTLFVLVNLLTNFVTALENVMAITVSGVLTTFTTIIGSIFFLIVLKIGLFGYLLAACLGQLFSCIFLALVIVLKYKDQDDKNVLLISFSPDVDKHLRKEMVAYSVPLILNNVSWWINGSLDRYIIVAYVGIAQSGIYSVASKIPTIISVIQSIFGQAWSLSSVKESNSENRSEFFGNIYSIYVSLMMISSSILILCNNFISRFLFSKDFFIAREYSTILILSSVISGMGGILSATFSITKQTKVLASTSIITAFINVVLNLLLIPRIGNYGAAIATTISFFVMWIIRYFKSQKLISFEYKLIKDIFSLIILVIQVLLSHFSFENKWLYVLQFLSIIILVIIHKKNILVIFSKFYTKIFNKRKIKED